jgi:hypothetical protein
MSANTAHHSRPADEIKSSQWVRIVTSLSSFGPALSLNPVLFVARDSSSTTTESQQRYLRQVLPH